MKELSIEEKAKAYDKAIEKAKDMLSYKEVRREDMEYLFPELKESEDERIRKHLISFFDNLITFGNASICETEDIKVDDILAWLEKQGEQKPTWSEEDEISFKETIAIINKWIEYKDKFGYTYKDTEIGKQSIDWLKSLKDRVQPPKQEWSEEDENILTSIIAYVNTNTPLIISQINWLKSLKPQPKQEWSEEDKKMCNDIIQFIEKGWTDNGKSHLIPWLKSLRHRLQWKPSDEQMYSLNWVANVLLKQDGIVEKETSKILDSLYNDLKKLKE